MSPFSRLSKKIAGVYRFVKIYGQHLPLAAKAIFNFSCTVMMIRGSIRGCDSSVVLHYVGRRWNQEFLLNLFFESHEIVRCEKSTVFTARARSKMLASDSDIEIIDIGWPYNGRLNKNHDFLQFADWINMILPLQEEWDDVVRSFRNTTRNNDLRLIRRNQYRYEVTNDRRIVESFYNDMYLPTANRRHGASSIVAPRKHVLKRAQQGKLLQVFRDDVLVIAGVIYPEDDILYFLWQGSPGSFQERPAEGAASALYYFGIRYAFDNEISAVDFAGTRAFLDFGDFRFKRKWGAFVDDSFSPNAVLLRPLNDGKDALSFFEHFPLIARGDDGLEAVIVRSGETVDTDMLEKLIKNYDCAGLDRIRVIAISDRANTTTESREIRGCKFQVIQCRPDQFSGYYVGRSSAAH